MSNVSGGSSGKANDKMGLNASFGSHIEHSIKSCGSVFVKENYGNIKDFYKISSCIGRGKFKTPKHQLGTFLINQFYRCFRRSQKMSTQRDQGAQSSEDHK